MSAVIVLVDDDDGPVGALVYQVEGRVDRLRRQQGDRRVDSFGNEAGRAQDLGPETGHIIAGGQHGRFLYETAGKPEKHGPQAVLARPVNQGVGSAQQTLA